MEGQREELPLFQQIEVETSWDFPIGTGQRKYLDSHCEKKQHTLMASRCPPSTDYTDYTQSGLAEGKLSQCGIPLVLC